MGRRLRTSLPTFPESLQPALPDLQAVQRKEQEQREKGASYFNLRHRAKDLPETCLVMFSYGLWKCGN